MYNILLAEDEKVIRDGLAATIEHLSRDFTVAWLAENGAKAIDFLQTSRPDVLITDIRMPVKGGLDLIKQARIIYPNLQIVIISGYDEFEYAQMAMREGVKYYLLKPIRASELTWTLDKIKTELQPHTHSQATTENEHSKIREMKKVIKEQLDQDLTLQKIGEIMNLHPNYISTLFKQETGKKLSDYITEARLMKAKDLLVNSKLKVYEVAYTVGYRDERHFMSIFKKHEGCSPTQFRNMKISE